MSPLGRVEKPCEAVRVWMWLARYPALMPPDFIDAAMSSMLIWSVRRDGDLMNLAAVQKEVEGWTPEEQDRFAAYLAVLPAHVRGDCPQFCPCEWRPRSCRSARAPGYVAGDLASPP